MAALPSIPDKVAVLPRKEGGDNPDAPKPPHIPKAEAAKKSELEKVKELRKKLGFPEESPLLKTKEAIERDRKQVVEGFLQKNEQALQDGWLGEKTRERKEEFVTRKVIAKEQREDRLRSPITRLERAATTRWMELNGLKNADAILSEIEDRVPHLRMKYFREKSVIEGLKRVENIGVAIDRFEGLGYRLVDYALKSEEFVGTLQTLAAIPEDKYRQIATDMDRYFFLHKSHDGLDLNEKDVTGDLRALAGVVKNQGFTEEEKDKLELARTFAIATDKVPFINSTGIVFSREDYHSDLTLDKVLSEGISGKVGKDIAWIVENMVYESNGGVKFSQYFFPNAFSLAGDGGVAIMSELSERGWDPLGAEVAINSYGFTEEGKAQEIAKLREALVFSSDTEKTAWVALIKELTGKEEEKKLVSDETGLYERLYENRLAIPGLAVFAKETGVELSRLMSFSGGEMYFAGHDIAEKLYEMSAKPDVSPEDASFYRRMQFYLTQDSGDAGGHRRFVDDKNIPLLAYFMVNKDRFGELYGEDGPTAMLVAELLQQKIPLSTANRLVGNCNEIEKVPPELVFANRILFRPEQMYKAVEALPDSYLASLPAAERGVYEICRRMAKSQELYQGNLEYILNHMENAAEYVVNGHFTPKLVENYARDKGDPYGVGSLLTKDTIATFPENERAFWTMYLEMPPGGSQKFMVSHINKFPEYFANGCMTATFINDYVAESAFPQSLDDFLSDEAVAAFPETERAFWGFVKKAPPIMQRYLYESRDRFEEYVKDGKAQVGFVHELVKYGDMEEVDSILTDATIADFPEAERPFWVFVRQAPSGVRGFVYDHRDRFAGYVSEGAMQYALVKDFLQEGNSMDELLPLITAESLTTFPEAERPFWLYVKDANEDIRNFLYAKPREFYVKDGKFDGAAVTRDFLEEVRAAPENCKTYESLISLFADLRQRHPGGDELGELYLRIAAAHRVRSIDGRTEVERMEQLRESFSSLYHEAMTPFERLSWKILQRQLPFTANEQVRTDMRQKAVDVEQLDEYRRLEWVHQSVHNYASVYEVDYLRGFREFLQTGDRSALDTQKARFTEPISRAPDYTSEDRQVLLAIPTLGAELDQMIELTSQFYEIRPETFRHAMDSMPDFGDPALPVQMQKLYEQILVLSKAEVSDPLTSKEAAVSFIRESNGVRKKVLGFVGREEATLQERTSGLLLDAILDDVSQKAFTQYKDYIVGKADLSQEDVMEAASMFGEAVIASYLSGEVGEDVVSVGEKLRSFKDPTSVSREAIHSARLLLPVLKRSIDSYWQRFTEAARPEMVQMLMRTGMSEKEATERVMFTDLVEFRKSSTAFLLDPIGVIVDEQLAKIEPGFEANLPAADEAYKPQSFEVMIDAAQSNPEVVAFAARLMGKRMPGETTEASRFLTDLANSPEAKVAKLVGVKVAEYIDKRTLKPRYTKVERNGKTIEFFPVAYYGVDMAVVLENGKRVENPYEFFKKNFEVLAVDERLLREGD